MSNSKRAKDRRTKRKQLSKHQRDIIGKNKFMEMQGRDKAVYIIRDRRQLLSSTQEW